MSEDEKKERKIVKVTESCFLSKKEWYAGSKIVLKKEDV